jgi:putative hemolysin
MIEKLNDIQSNIDYLITDNKMAEETFGKFSDLIFHLEYLEEKDLREPKRWLHI